jgi:hypothetical protein
MTLVLSVHNRDTMWVVVDRRLSYGRGRRPVDDAVKVMSLETTDGVGLLAYAGLGATSNGTQPSEWMSAVLRGHGGLGFEQALGVLATAATKELPRHLVRMPGGAHSIMVPAFVRGIGSRLYTIDNRVDSKAGIHSYRYTSYQRTAGPTSTSARLGLAGTGGLYLMQNRALWQGRLLGLVKAQDRAKISPYIVADELARLNYEAHERVRDGTVGPRCIVVWRRRRDASSPGSGGAHQFYSGPDREPDSGTIPMIDHGKNVSGIATLVMKCFQDQISDAAFSFDSGLHVDPDEMNRLLGELPSDPDERLR